MSSTASKYQWIKIKALHITANHFKFLSFTKVCSTFVAGTFKTKTKMCVSETYRIPCKNLRNHQTGSTCSLVKMQIITIEHLYFYYMRSLFNRDVDTIRAIIFTYMDVKEIIGTVEAFCNDNP